MTLAAMTLVAGLVVGCRQPPATAADVAVLIHGEEMHYELSGLFARAAQQMRPFPNIQPIRKKLFTRPVFEERCIPVKC